MFAVPPSLRSQEQDLSPRARLRCYPDGDGQFGKHAALTLRIELPDSYSMDDVVHELERKLRERYPLARIQVQSDDPADDTPTWHVYRDGVPPA
jgi:hypothetical protein